MRSTLRGLSTAWMLALWALPAAAENPRFGERPPITDEQPRMEFFRNQGGNMNDREIATLLAVPQDNWTWVRGLKQRPDLAERVARENRALRLYVESTVEGNVQAGTAAARLGRGTEFFLYRLGCATEQLERLPPEASGQLQRCRALVP